jgi:O-acetyl-ADP-ribose deacetylase (regulator of RNase III)
MLTYLKTSLFDSPAHALVNTVNTVGVMGKGIAATFKRLYPGMFREYKELCLDGSLTIGKLHVFRTPNKVVINFPTKKDWRRPSKLEYVEAGLQAFVDHYSRFGVASVSFPQLGCGNGELDWDSQVRPVMERYLKDLAIPVYIHLYGSQPDFVPEHLDRGYIRRLQLERQVLSATDAWADFVAIIKGIDNSPPSIFDPQRLENEVEELVFKAPDGQDVRLHRAQFDDLWNILRLRGTLSESDLRLAVSDPEKISALLDRLSDLEYVYPQSLRVFGADEYQRGLSYVAPVDTNRRRKLMSIS